MRGLTRWVVADERRHVAEEEARHVEDVDAEVLDDEALVGGEVGLRRVDVEPGAEADPPPERPPDRRHLGPRPPDRRLPAEVLVHHQRRARPRRPPRPWRARRPSSSAKGFWQIMCTPAAGRQLHQRPVARHRRRDVDEVEPLRRQHLARVGVGPRDPEAAPPPAPAAPGRGRRARRSPRPRRRARRCRWFVAKKPQPMSAPRSIVTSRAPPAGAGRRSPAAAAAPGRPRRRR